VIPNAGLVRDPVQIIVLVVRRRESIYITLKPYQPVLKTVIQGIILIHTHVNYVLIPVSHVA
jgi:hypothetical protein